MKYSDKIILKNGKTALLRNGVRDDGQAALDNFNLTHGETDFLITYPDENRLTAADEGEFLAQKEESEDELEIVAEVEGKIVGMAGINGIGASGKIKHRAEFGVAVAKDYWGLGLGRAMTEVCIDAARKAGFTQLELEAVAENESALSLYRKLGFIEYGRNPMGFRLRTGDYSELVYMRLEL